MMTTLFVFGPMVLLWGGSAAAAYFARGVWRWVIPIPALLGLAYTIHGLLTIHSNTQGPVGIMILGMFLLPIAGCLAAVGIPLSRNRAA